MCSETIKPHYLRGGKPGVIEIGGLPLAPGAANIKGDEDAKALKRDAEKHRDWKSATEVTGTVAQRRRKSGQHELQDRPLDKYSRSSARRRVKSLDDTRKVRPDQNAAVRRASFESKPRGREAFGSRLSAAVRKERQDRAEERKKLLGALDGLPRKVGEAGVGAARRRATFS